MLNPDLHPEAVRRLSSAVGNIARELLDAGVPHAALAAGLRIEAGNLERAGPREGMTADELEMVDLARQAHEFINTLQVAGVEERTAVTCILSALIERVVRTGGVTGAANWLRAMARHVDQNGAALEQTSRHH